MEMMSTTLSALKSELDQLSSSLKNVNKNDESTPPAAILVERSLFIGRLLFAFQKHSRHIPVILGSPRSWVNDTVAGVSLKSPSAFKYSRSPFDSSAIESPRNKIADSSKRHTSLTAAALFGIDDSPSPQLEELDKTTQDLCIRAHNLWISWVSDELSSVLSANLRQDETLSTTAILRGWEKIFSKESSLMKVNRRCKYHFLLSLLFMLPRFYSKHVEKFTEWVAMYLISQFYKILPPDYWKMSSAFIWISSRNLTVLSVTDVPSRIPKIKVPFRRKQDVLQVKSAIRERLDDLFNRLSQRLDPIGWLTYEPFLWENEKQTYLRHAVLFGFFVQLNRLYTDTSQKLPTNSESNIMRCSDVPRFKYLPISAPALSSRPTVKASAAASVDDVSSKSPWKSFTDDELAGKIDVDDNSSLGMAAPLLKSFMQVGSRFGESTLRLGSILTDGQGRFGDLLPAQAAGLLSSFTATRSDS